MRDKHGRNFYEGKEPDTRPGPYYVSAIDGPRTAYIAGPFKTHSEALAMVDKAREVGCKVDPKAVFYGFGTCRLSGYTEGQLPVPPLGVLNSRLGLPV